MKRCCRREARTSGSACPRSFQGGKSLKKLYHAWRYALHVKAKPVDLQWPLDIVNLAAKQSKSPTTICEPQSGVHQSPSYPVYYRYAYSIPSYSHCTTIFVSYCKSVFITHQQGFLFIIMHLSIVSPNVRRLKYVKTVLKPKSMVAKSPLYSI